MLESLGKSSANYELLDKKTGKQAEEFPVRGRLEGDESADEVRDKVDRIFFDYNNEVQRVFSAIDFNRELPEKQKKEIKALLAERKKIVSALYDGVEKNGALSGIEKKELNFETDLFMILHCYFGKLKINSKNFTRKTVRGYNGKEKKVYSDNQRNVALAETQQFLAMLIIASGKHDIASIATYAGKIKELYYDGGEQNLSKDKEDDPVRQLEKGISGLAAAYYYYQSKGYSVIISSPAMDANQKIDLFLVDTKRMRNNQVAERECDFKAIKTLEDIPAILRPYVTVVQVKCHADKTGRESKELIYSPQLLADYVEKINHHRLIKYYEKRFGSAGENPHGGSGENGDEWEGFEEKFKELEFPETVKIEDLEIPSGFCARYIDLKMKDAKELINSAGVADRGWTDIHQERVIGEAIYGGGKR